MTRSLSQRQVHRLTKSPQVQGKEVIQEKPFIPYDSSLSPLTVENH